MLKVRSSPKFHHNKNESITIQKGEFMNVKAFVMTTAFLLATSTSFAAIHSDPTVITADDNYETKWCRDVSFILNASLSEAHNAQTFEQEVVILETAIAKTLNIINPKISFYFDTTLKLGVKIESALENSKDKAIFLRRNIQAAISDLYFFDLLSSRNSQDHGNYVVHLLKRTLSEGMRSKTDQIELLILKAGIQNGIEILAESDNRRNGEKACATKYLKEALVSGDIIFKRELVNQAVNSIQKRCY
jgi:hypothetical protein